MTDTEHQALIAQCEPHVGRPYPAAYCNTPEYNPESEQMDWWRDACAALAAKLDAQAKDQSWLLKIASRPEDIARIGEVIAERDALAKRLAEAAAMTDGVDYQIEHFRANRTPNELRDVILGLAVRLAEQSQVIDRLVEACRDSMRLIDNEADCWAARTVAKCRAAIAEAEKARKP